MQLRGLVVFLIAAFGVSIRRSCRVLDFNLSSYFYRTKRPDQSALVMRLKELAAAKVRYGYLRLQCCSEEKGGW